MQATSRTRAHAGDTGDGNDSIVSGSGDNLLVTRDGLLDVPFTGAGGDSAFADEDDTRDGVERVA